MGDFQESNFSSVAKVEIGSQSKLGGGCYIFSAKCELPVQDINTSGNERNRITAQKMPTEQEDFYCGIGEFIMLQPEGNKNIVEIIWKYKKLGI